MKLHIHIQLVAGKLIFADMYIGVSMNNRSLSSYFDCSMDACGPNYLEEQASRGITSVIQDAFKSKKGKERKTKGQKRKNKNIFKVKATMK